MNIAVLVSGNGSNLQALMDAEDRGELADGKIVLVLSDKPEAYALKRAEGKGIKTLVIEKTGFSSREDYDKEVAKKLKEADIELVVLAGFMRILSEYFISEFKDRIINIHPALLPSFKGVHGIKDAYESGVKVTGVTVHFATKELDAGPVILQAAVAIDKDDTLESLEEKIHAVEHRLYPEAVRLFVEGRLSVEGNKVVIR